MKVLFSNMLIHSNYDAEISFNRVGVYFSLIDPILP